MSLLDLLVPALHDRYQPVVTTYDLYLLALKIIKKRKYKELQLKRRPSGWDYQKLSPLLRMLQRKKIVAPDPDFGPHVWVDLRNPTTSSAEEVCCLVDPFCYVSHLSAMQRLGLSNRAPKHLHITRPNALAWKELALVKVSEDMEPYADLAPAPRLHRIGFRPVIRKRPLQTFETIAPGTGEAVGGESSRISSIGRTFVDTLDQPNLCGGIHHVLEVWEEYAGERLDEIVAAVNMTETKVIKVRAGYILEERLGITDVRISAWLSAAQRGGSAKLDPETEYRPPFSEKWMLSINV